MSLPPGTRLGNYEILAPIGAGGMGEVYRARDTRLDRVVAIKALPAGLTQDPERLARFEREARLLASLNHPNIAAIYGIEEDSGSGAGSCLVLEFVEGETLAQRIARGSLTVRETLEVGGQIASAIEAAHEGGIVHRDLKPGNVMLTASRVVKVLDFGLAKGGEAVSGSSPNLSASPTMAMSATAAGIIIGTAPYMSPEQARGKAVDRRADIWAFGCVLLECLTGRQTFSGETVSDVIARILERDPDWSALPASVPPRLRDLIRRCLTKDVNERPRDVGDLRRELSAIGQDLSGLSREQAPAAELPSLAVLYFENLAKDSESEYFCSGITEDILTDLSKIKGLRVASRNAVLRYRGVPTDLPKIAEDLGVRAVLEGSVRRAGERVRITAQLVNAADGFQLWAERYDRTLEDVFAVQEEIASSIAAALRVALTPAESQQLAQNRPSDVRAYDLFLKGRERYGSYTAESLREALGLFQQAIAIDAGYALAWAGVADCYGQTLQWGYAPDVEEAKRLGLEAARKASTLNPKLADAYKAEGLVLRFAGDLAGSKAALIKAVEANPQHIPSLINLAVEAFCRADLAAAERFIRRSLEVDPQEPFATTWLGWLAHMTGRVDETLAAADRLRRLSDDPFYVTAVYIFRAWVVLDRGDLGAAERVVREGLADQADPANLRAIEALIAARAGRLEEARRWVVELTDSPGLGSGALTIAANAAARIGDLDRAARFMGRSLLTDLNHTIVRLEPDLHSLLDRAPFAPRRRAVTLVWPLEAPMIDEARFAVFREVRVDTGRHHGSDVLRGRADAH